MKYPDHPVDKDARETAAVPASAGFTLLEMLVVLFIMGLLVAQMLPSFSQGADTARLRASASDIADDLRIARAVAIRTSREAGLTFDQSSRSYGIPGSKEIRQLADNIGLTITAVTWRVPGSAQAGIQFFPDGSSTGGSIAVTQGSRLYHITIDWLTGRVTVGD